MRAHVLDTKMYAISDAYANVKDCREKNNSAWLVTDQSGIWSAQRNLVDAENELYNLLEDLHTHLNK